MSKKVIVTGSQGLIGKEISCFLEKTGYYVIKCSRSLGHDLTDEDFVKEWFKENQADHLINLFAMNEHIDKNTENVSNLYNISLESFDQYMKTNVTSLFSVCRAYADNNWEGNIINFSSIYGLKSPDPRIYKNGKHKHAGYAVSKSAVIHLTRYLAAHLAPRIRVNCVIPGGVESNQSSEFMGKYSSKSPIQRMMKVSELNGLIKFLCSDDSSYCTGSEFVVDGGYTIW
tara:strand:- start:1169 stop:1855 length:687 start_codon:yes stop_codon:yes gene_type:complete